MPLVPITDPTIAVALRTAAGPGGCIDDPAAIAACLADWRGRFTGQAAMVLQPGTTQAVADVIRLCARHGIGVVPQGGNTGLVGGSVPRATAERPQILLSASRLRNIISIDTDNDTLTAQSGCVLAVLQQAADAAGRLFPLSLGAEGSCQLGGNISTNAGGTAVLRFGTMRDLVLGLEVVLPDGRVWNGLRGLRKDNTGYDLKQLFIGAEGTLGFITAATCKLYPRPRDVATALLALNDVNTAVELYARARESLGSELVAFEFMNPAALALAVGHLGTQSRPFDRTYGCHVLVEIASVRHAARCADDLEGFLARMLDAGTVVDGVMARSGAQRAALWGLRHAIPEAERRAGPALKHDVSVPVSAVGRFIAEATSRVGAVIPNATVIAFGHLGDGNVHFNVALPTGDGSQGLLARAGEVTGTVHALCADFDGSFSAEHGIGRLKMDELQRWRGGVSLDLMRAIKQALDPAGIMNPGALIRGAAAGDAAGSGC